jgi:hypothetical protein
VDAVAIHPFRAPKCCLSITNNEMEFLASTHLEPRPGHRQGGPPDLR